MNKIVIVEMGFKKIKKDTIIKSTINSNKKLLAF